MDIQSEPLSILVLSARERELLRAALLEFRFAALEMDSTTTKTPTHCDEVSALADLLEEKRTVERSQILSPTAVDFGEGQDGDRTWRPAGIVWNVPTYNGVMPDYEALGLAEYVQGDNPVKVTFESGLRLVIGETAGTHDAGKPSVVIERQADMWVVFVHPDPSGSEVIVSAHDKGGYDVVDERGRQLLPT